MERGTDEARQKGMICPPGFPSCLTLHCFFSGTSGTLGDKSPVSLANSGLRLSHSGWDNGRFSWDTVGHFVPDEHPRAILRKDDGVRGAWLYAPRCVNFGANLISLPPSMGGDKSIDCVIPERGMMQNKSTLAMDAETVMIVEYAIKRAFEVHPRPSAVTQKQAAEMLGVSQATVSRCVKTGVIKINKMGMVPIGEVDRVLAAH